MRSFARPERAAEGVWRIRGGFPGRRFVNVYLIEDDGGVTIYDCGIKQMARDITAAAQALGGAKRIVLGHSHADHRGAAALLNLPVWCHRLERADAEGDAGEHYFTYSGTMPHERVLLPRFLHAWDAGPVRIAHVVDDGDMIAGFHVVHIPGHAPGQIALFRETDGVALTSDCFYTLDISTFRYVPARVTHEGVNHDTEQARQSIKKLAELEPRIAWPGHAEPVTGDVRAELVRAAGASTNKRS